MPQKIIGALRVLLSANTASFDRGMSSADRRLTRFGRNMTRVLTAMAASGAVALVAMTRNSLATIDAQAKLAKQTGTTVASIQTLTHAGALAGVSMGEMANNVSQLNRRLGEAALHGTGTAKRALDSLGISVESLLDLDAAQRFEVISDALSGLGSEAEQSAAAYDLFGRAGATMVPLLQEGGDAIRAARLELEEFGSLVSEVEKKQIEAANDAVTRLGLAFQGLSNQLAVEFAPTLESTATAIGDFIVEQEDLIEVAGKAATIIGGGLAGAALGRLLTVIPKAIAGITGLATALRLGTASAITFQAALGPIGIVLGLVSGALVVLAGSHNDSKRATELHEAALASLRDEVAAADGQSRKYIETLIAEKRAALDIARAILAVAAAKAEEAKIALAATFEGRINDPRGLDDIQRQKLQREHDDATARWREQAESVFELDLALSKLNSNLESTPELMSVVRPSGGQAEATRVQQADVALVQEEGYTAGLEALTQSLATTEESERASWEARSDQLKVYLAEGQITNREYFELIRRLDSQFQETKLDIQEEGQDAAQASADEAGRLSLQRAQSQQDQETAITLRAEEDRANLRRQAASDIGRTLGSLSRLISTEGKKQFRIAKGLAIAEALINVAVGVTRTLGQPFGIIRAIATVAAGAVQIAAIRRQQPGGSGSPSSGGGGGGGGGGSTSRDSGGGGGGGGGGGAAPVVQTLHVVGLKDDEWLSGARVRGIAQALIDFQENGGQVVIR